MRKILVVILCVLTTSGYSQSGHQEIEKACLNYIEGFYEGDTAKLASCLQPTVYKFGYMRNKATGLYEPDGQMTYEDAMKYASSVFEKKRFPRQDAPKKVQVLDIMESIAAAKITAWWGTDYLLLVKQGGQWKISEILWEGPLRS